MQRKTGYHNQKNTDDININRTKIYRKQKWEEKQLYGYFKQQTSEILHENILTWLRKENLKRETQNNSIRTNCVKARIDKTQQNSVYR